MAKNDFGQWEPVRPLGEGGQGHTFIVREKGKEGSAEFVLKRLKNDKRIQRFRSEIEAGLKLSHPNLVNVIDYDLDAKSPYLVTEYCKGGALSKSATSEKPLLDNLRTFLAICQGVAHAHRPCGQGPGKLGSSGYRSRIMMDATCTIARKFRAVFS